MYFLNLISKLDFPMQIIAVPTILVLKPFRLVLLPCAHPPNAVALQNHKSLFTKYIYVPFFMILRIKTMTLLNTG